MEVIEALLLNPMEGILSSCQTTASSVITTPFFKFFSSPIFSFLVDTSEKTHTAQYEEPSVPSQVRMILDWFGLSKSDLSKILGITRPALYAWLDEQSEPNVENIRRLHAIYEIIREWPEAEQQPLFHAYIERPVAGFSHSLIETLSSTNIDVEEVRAMIRVIRGMTADRNTRIGKNRPRVEIAAYYKHEQRQILEDNLLAIETEG